MSITEFEIPEIDLIIGSASAEEDPDDEVPEETSEVITQLGDLWSLGEHTIFCGDARNDSSFATLMGNRRASVVFADPPYNVVIDGHASGNGQIHHSEFAMASGEMSEAEFTEFLASSLGQLAKWSPTGPCISSLWIGVICRNYLRQENGSMTSCSTFVSGTKTTAVWGRSITRSMS